MMVGGRISGQFHEKKFYVISSIGRKALAMSVHKDNKTSR